MKTLLTLAFGLFCLSTSFAQDTMPATQEGQVVSADAPKEQIVATQSVTVPSVLGATSTTATVRFGWTPPPDTITTYKVYEKVAGVYNLKATFPAPASTYDLLLVPSGTHVYALTALNGTLESLKSNEVTATVLTIPAAPTGLTATVVTTP